MSMTRTESRFDVAAVQAAPIWMDTTATIERACSLIREAASHGARLVAFPEVYVPGYPYWNWIMTPFEGSRWFRILSKQSVLVPGEHTNALCAQARASSVYVVIGMNERSPISAGTIYNTNLVINPDGEIIGRHRKLVPTWAEKLTWGVGDGSSLRVYDTEIGHLGTLACGENTNTLARFALLAQGEEIHVANYPAFPFNQYDMVQAISLRAGAHSFEGKVYTIVASSVLTNDIIDAVCATETQREMMTHKPNAMSAVFGPDGMIIGTPLIDDEGIVYAEIDLDLPIELKQMHDIVGHYNRFDVLSLHLNRSPIQPLFESGAQPIREIMDGTAPSDQDPALPVNHRRNA
jgi:predicted amidohydrolase